MAHISLLGLPLACCVRVITNHTVPPSEPATALPSTPLSSFPIPFPFPFPFPSPGSFSYHERRRRAVGSGCSCGGSMALPLSHFHPHSLPHSRPVASVETRTEDWMEDEIEVEGAGTEYGTSTPHPRHHHYLLGLLVPIRLYRHWRNRAVRVGNGSGSFRYPLQYQYPRRCSKCCCWCSSASSSPTRPSTRHRPRRPARRATRARSVAVASCACVPRSGYKRERAG